MRNWCQNKLNLVITLAATILFTQTSFAGLIDVLFIQNDG
jgi:hypothetical protein